MRRRIAIALSIFVVVVAALAIAAVVWRIELAGGILRYALARSGFAGARFAAVERVDLGAIEVSGVEAGARLRAERVEVALALRRLPGMPVERVRVIGARIDLGAESGGGAEPKSRSDEMPLALVPVLELERAVVETPSPVGPIVLRLDSRVSPEPGAVAMTLRGAVESAVAKATLRADARLDDTGAVSIGMDVASIDIDDPRLRVETGSATLALNGHANGFDLEAATGSLAVTLGGVVAGERKIGAVAGKAPFEIERGETGWAATISDAHVELPDEQLEVSSVSGRFSKAATELELGRVVEKGTDRRFEPLTVRLRATPPRFAGTVASAGGRATLRFDGSYDAAEKGARVRLVWPRVELDPKGLQPADLSPLLSFRGSVTGGVEGNADLRWTSGRGVDGRVSVTLDGVSFEARGVRADRLDGKVELVSLFPPTTKDMQGLRVRELDPGVALTDSVLLFRLEPAEARRGSRLRIERFLTGFAGGRIVVEGAVLDPLATENQVVFRLEDIDVARLFEIAAIEGVSGSGRLAGAIPVTVRGNEVAIPEGTLAAGSGVLQIRSESTANLLAGGGRSAELLLEALRDFHYDELTMSVVKTFTGEATVKLRLAGNNPAVLEGHPFRINVNLTGNLDRLVRALLEIARLSDQAVRATVQAAH